MKKVSSFTQLLTIGTVLAAATSLSGCILTGTVGRHRDYDHRICTGGGWCNNGGWNNGGWNNGGWNNGGRNNGGWNNGGWNNGGRNNGGWNNGGNPFPGRHGGGFPVPGRPNFFVAENSPENFSPDANISENLTNGENTSDELITFSEYVRTLDPTALSNHYGLKVESTKRVLDAASAALDGDQSKLLELGFSKSDLKALANLEVHGVADVSFEKVAANLEAPAILIKGLVSRLIVLAYNIDQREQQ